MAVGQLKSNMKLISKFFQWAYLVLGVLFCFEGFAVLFGSEEPKGNAIPLFLIGGLGFAMYFFKRKFGQRLNK